MRIYQKLGGGDIDVISDGYKMVQLDEYNKIVVEVQSRMVVKGGVEVDVGCGNAFGGKIKTKKKEELDKHPLKKSMTSLMHSIIKNLHSIKLP